ncbi:MAG: TlpA family protein disulfide reductase [Cellulomonadaceae bacterium]
MATSTPARPAPLRRGLAALALAALALGGCSGTPAAQGTDDVPDQGYVSGDGSVRTWVPDERGEPVVLAGTDFAGEQVDTADYAGDVVVINTWFAACPPCRAEAPILHAIATERADEGVHVVGLNRVDAAGAAQAFERTYDVPYPSISDPTGEVTAVLEGVVPIQGTPTTVVLDPQGRVAARVFGMLEQSTIDALIDDVVAERT